MQNIDPGVTGKSRVAGDEKLALSIAEFCARHSISVAYFYELRKRGLAPRVMRLGTRRLISVEEAARWRQAHTSEA